MIPRAPAATVCRHLSIHGRVQGVGFRWSLQSQALRLELKGWVRNRRDGSVEAWICGAPEAVEALTHWAHRGPPEASVQHVLSSDSLTDAPVELPVSFEQKPTL